MGGGVVLSTGRGGQGRVTPSLTEMGTRLVFRGIVYPPVPHHPESLKSFILVKASLAPPGHTLRSPRTEPLARRRRQGH